ncbi:MAG: DNRLRE domain-containing protein, partial [Candidatus Eremiobacteraeota bacterium]|nr:DNRLRE domain-containing protein [Candidatus Eremiobacteraeota bacterium]
WIHNISPGQSDIYSNKVSFSVTCATPAPPPTLAPPPPSPNSLGNTNDPQVCTAHAGLGGGLACSAGFGNHWLALVWSCNNCKADGYRIYRVDGGQRTLVPPNGAYNKDATVTLAVLPTPNGGFSGKCYSVTAYKGSSESNDSNTYCVNGPIDTPIVRSFNLVPNNTRTVYHHHSYAAPVPGCGLPTNGLGESPGLTVGFIHDFCSTLGVTGYSDTMIYQSALSFDLGAAGILLRNSKASVKSATLTFQRDDGTNSSCLAAVHLPTGDWSNAQELIPNNDYISGIPWSTNDVSASGPFDGHMVLIGGGKYSIDVTSAIQGFAKGTIPDYGFLLMGGNETRETSDNNSCANGYGSFGLNVQVLVQP